MYFISSIKKKMLLAVLSIPVATIAMAQDAAKTAEKTVVSENNQLAYLLIITSAVLAFVIWGMGKILIELSRQVMRKYKKAPSAFTIALVIGLSLMAQGVFAQTPATDAVKVVSNYGGLSETAFYVYVAVIGIEIFAICFLAFSIKRIYKELLPAEDKAAVQKSALGEWWAGMDKKIFTKAIPVEKEADVLLDHNYDGIRELDNALPPWWKYGFYITICVAFVYLLNFHVLGYGKNPDQEYVAEMEQAKIAQEAYDMQNKDKIDESKVPMADAAGIKAGQEMFEANCVACHVKGGGGNVGPNLTDDYWLHKGSLNDIYKSIKNGYPDKGMQAWSVKFNPKEISYLASYIKSIRGTNPPNAKAPQGELYVEAAAAPVAADSTQVSNVKTDSTVKAK